MSNMICLTPVKEKQYYQAFTMKDGKEYILQLVTSTDIVDTFQRDEMKAILENIRRNPPKFNDGTLLDVNKFNIVGTRMKVPIEQSKKGVRCMPRPKGSKNKPKIDSITGEVIKATRKRKPKEPREPFKLSTNTNTTEIIIGIDTSSQPDQTGYFKPPKETTEHENSKDKEWSKSASMDTERDTGEMASKSRGDLDTEQREVPEGTKAKSNRPERKQNTGRNNKANYPVCDCCSKAIYCQPHRIDTNILTAQVADYHRETPRWINLCTECAKELSDTVDNWLREHGCFTKFEIKAIENGITYEDKDDEDIAQELKKEVDIDDDSFEF